MFVTYPYKPFSWTKTGLYYYLPEVLAQDQPAGVLVCIVSFYILDSIELFVL